MNLAQVSNEQSEFGEFMPRPEEIIPNYIDKQLILRMSKMNHSPDFLAASFGGSIA